MRFLIPFAVLIISITGCAQSGYQQFYNPYVDASLLPDVELLAEGQDPIIFETDDFDRDVLVLRSKRYVPIGYSSFNGKYEGKSKLVAQARRIGATTILTNSEYTGTETSTSTLFLPDNRTSYHAGSVYGGTGSYLGSYTGTSTSYGTQAVPVTSQTRRYDQSAVFFVKSNAKIKFGLSMSELTPEIRSQIGRNTGAYISAVIEDTPAFYANVLNGDVLISVDGKLIKSVKHAQEIMAEVSPENDYSILTVLRGGKEKDIKISFSE